MWSYNGNVLRNYVFVVFISQVACDKVLFLGKNVRWYENDVKVFLLVVKKCAVNLHRFHFTLCFYILSHLWLVCRKRCLSYLFLNSQIFTLILYNYENLELKYFFNFSEKKKNYNRDILYQRNTFEKI